MDVTLLRRRAGRPGSVVRLLGPAAVAAGAAAVVAALVVRDPHVPGSWGNCVFLQATGLYCPGCGGLRAVNELAHLDIVAALSSNVFAVVLAVLTALIWAAWARSQATGRPVAWDRWITPLNAYLLLGSMSVFSVLRNTPLLASLTP